MQNKQISIIVPVYNGAKFIRKNLEHLKSVLPEYFPNFEIIVVIDGKTDDSLKEAKKVKGIKLVSYKKNQGKGYALKKGFELCTGDYVTFIDADLDFPPRQLKNFIPYMATADIIIGSKRHPFSKLKYPFFRKVLSKGFQIISKIVLGVSLRDTQSGLKLMKREALEILMPLVVVKRYAFDLELMFLAQKHGFRTVEAPIKVDFKGNSGINFKTIFKTIFGMFLDILAIRYRYSILKYYQKKYHEVFL